MSFIRNHLPPNLRGIQKIIESIQARKKGRFESEIVPVLQTSWTRADTNALFTEKGIAKYVSTTLESPRRWLTLSEEGNYGDMPNKEVRDRVCNRFNEYLTAIGYSETERQALFAEFRTYNSAVRFPGNG